MNKQLKLSRSNTSPSTSYPAADANNSNLLNQPNSPCQGVV